MDGLEWRFLRGKETLAFVRPDGRSLYASPPAVEGSYWTTPAFSSYSHQFDRELELWPDCDEMSNDEWQEIWEEIWAPGLFLESLNGLERVEIYWIHFKNGRAWWLPLYDSPNTYCREYIP